MQKERTAGDVIRELRTECGGVPNLTRALRLHAPTGAAISDVAVQKWIERDQVPWKWRGAVSRLAKKKHIEIPKDFLGA